MKIFEIPIYALSKETLSKRVEEYIEKLDMELGDIPQKNKEKCIEIETFPNRAWEYNHIVGYITISIHKREIIFDIYLPYSKIEKYYWKSNRKKFIINTMLNGFHFLVNDKLSNSDIAKEITGYVNEIKKQHIPKGYYVDSEAFNALVYNVDFKKIIKKG